MIFDIVILIITFLLIYRGIKKGLIYMVFDICKILLSIYLIPYVYRFVKPKLLNYNDILVYFICFLIIFIVISIIEYLINSFIDSIHLGFLNKLAGAILGLLQSVFLTIIATISMLFLKEYLPLMAETLNTSYAVYYVSINTKFVNSFFPETVEKKLNDFYIKNQQKKLSDDILNKIKKELGSNEND